eukprot:gnl/MRDRNA2_/MRDRNA2_19930_c0_seq1.p1 gnl/MRDRNA2_/MRDRNA2_19930_c0~~gnl/MRDRNA2_/MRDRNA2_19930_c0_seq1.p1  ORF type:complete len:318 (+),score=27.25 gnl/MRDRNA2_/MRDRNA2_19930_c0_seq1:129-1082(+)
MLHCWYVAYFSLPAAFAIWMVDNVIYFDGIDSLRWSQDKYSMEPGQPFKCSVADGKSIDVIASAPPSSGLPATHFCNGLTSENILASKIAPPFYPETIAKWGKIQQNPELLQFAVFGNITLIIEGEQYEVSDLRIAQGGELFTHIWWIGGPYCVRHFFNHSDIGALNCGKLWFHSIATPNRFLVTVWPKASDVGSMHQSMSGLTRSMGSLDIQKAQGDETYTNELLLSRGRGSQRQGRRTSVGWTGKGRLTAKVHPKASETTWIAGDQEMVSHLTTQQNVHGMLILSFSTGVLTFGVLCLALKRRSEILESRLSLLA